MDAYQCLQGRMEEEVKAEAQALWMKVMIEFDIKYLEQAVMTSI